MMTESGVTRSLNTSMALHTIQHPDEVSISLADRRASAGQPINQGTLLKIENQQE
jgi:hypothetical protein